MKRKVTENEILSCFGKFILFCVVSKPEQWTLSLIKMYDYGQYYIFIITSQFTPAYGHGPAPAPIRKVGSTSVSLPMSDIL